MSITVTLAGKTSPPFNYSYAGRKIEGLIRLLIAFLPQFLSSDCDSAHRMSTKQRRCQCNLAMSKGWYRLFAISRVCLTAFGFVSLGNVVVTIVGNHFGPSLSCCGNTLRVTINGLDCLTPVAMSSPTYGTCLYLFDHRWLMCFSLSVFPVFSLLRHQQESHLHNTWKS